jgi:hypothetical protein
MVTTKDSIYWAARYYAFIDQKLDAHDSHDYATWYVYKFPDGDVDHNDERAFYAWTIRRSR